MTTNKPEVVAWYTPPVVALNDRPQRGVPLIRLSDYEALQAECEEQRNDLMDALRAAREFIRNQKPQTTKLPDGRVRLDEDLMPAMRILWKIDAALEGRTEKGR